MWEIRETYGVDVLRDWVAVMIDNLNDFCNVRDKMTAEQKDEAAHIISCDYGQLNIAEVALFFLKVKSGYFGEFYGILDTVRLLAILKKFMEERQRAVHAVMEKRAKDEKQRERDEWAKNAMPYEELQKAMAEGKFPTLAMFMGYSKEKKVT